MRKHWLMFAAAASAALLATMGAAMIATPTPSVAAAGGISSLAIQVPRVPGLITSHKTSSTACVLRAGTDVTGFHCYTPQQIRAAYGVDAVAPFSVGGSSVPDLGHGQRTVLVDWLCCLASSGTGV